MAGLSPISMCIAGVLVIAIVVLPPMLRDSTMLASLLLNKVNLALVVLGIILVSELDKVIGVLLLLLCALLVVGAMSHGEKSSAAPMATYKMDNLLTENFVRDKVPVMPTVAPTHILTSESIGKHISGLFATQSEDIGGAVDKAAMYGLPVSDCKAYDIKQVAAVGGVFYPLNA